MIGNMVQYSVLPNCTNNCKFCLRKDTRVLSTEEIIKRINDISENIDIVDWNGKFRKGISLLGGEVYGYRDEQYEAAFLGLVDKICTKILSVGPGAKYSTVTNGIYEPDFLYKCIDKIVMESGICHVDVNFSYDLKYRYRNERDRQLVLKNINAFHKRYEYRVGVQMILTQYVINEVLSNKWSIKHFEQKEIPGNQLVFLYPHPIRAEKAHLPDFFFRRDDFLKFMLHLEAKHQRIHSNTIMSAKNSGTFKYTGLFDPDKPNDQEPILADGKEVLQDTCGHSVLYQCYSDSDRCMLCDIEKIWGI